MPRNLVVFDMDMTISEGHLEEAYFMGMPLEVKESEILKGKKGEQIWPNLIKNAVETYPPAIGTVHNYL